VHLYLWEDVLVRRVNDDVESLKRGQHSRPIQAGLLWQRWRVVLVTQHGFVDDADTTSRQNGGRLEIVQAWQAWKQSSLAIKIKYWIAIKSSRLAES